MKFNYTASQSNGKIIEGEVEAQGVGEVLALLASKELKPISLKKVDSKTERRKLNIFQPSMGIADKIFLAKYLALMLKTGSDLFKSVEILILDSEKLAVKSFLFEIKNNLEKGLPFHTAFTKNPQYFSSVFSNLIKAGESSGTLEKTFEQLSEKLQKEQELKQEVRSALIYPIILMVMAVVVVLFIVTFALPKISKLFSDSGFEPPLFSKITFAVGLFLNQYFVFIVIGIFALIAVFFVLLNRSVAFKKLFQYLIRKLPLVGPLLKKIALQRFTSTFASLLSAGMPMVDALEISAQTVGDAEFKDAILRIAHEGIAKGLTIGEAFKKETVFPRVASNLIAISEKSGNISGILVTFSEFYELEIKSSVKVLVSFLEPLLLLFIGATIGIIALSIIIPIYQLVGRF